MGQKRSRNEVRQLICISINENNFPRGIAFATIHAPLPKSQPLTAVIAHFTTASTLHNTWADIGLVYDRSWNSSSTNRMQSRGNELTVSKDRVPDARQAEIRPRKTHSKRIWWMIYDVEAIIMRAWKLRTIEQERWLGVHDQVRYRSRKLWDHISNVCVSEIMMKSNREGLSRSEWDMLTTGDRRVARLKKRDLWPQHMIRNWDRRTKRKDM
jgi:hypothetical protein